MGRASKKHKQCIDCVLMDIRTHTHTQRQTAPSTHTCTHVHTHVHVLTHGYNLTQHTYILHTFTPHTPAYATQVHTQRGTHTHTRHTPTYPHAYVHTHAHTHTLTARSSTCKNALTHTCTRTHMYTQEDGIYRESPVVRSRWGEGLILGCEAACSRPIHPQYQTRACETSLLLLYRAWNTLGKL